MPYGEMLLTRPVNGSYVEYLVADIDVEPLPKYEDLECIRVSVSKSGVTTAA
jgi:hypothetical protein